MPVASPDSGGHLPDLLVDVGGDGVVTPVHQVLIDQRGRTDG